MRGRMQGYDEADITRLRQEGQLLINRVSMLKRLLEEDSEQVSDPDKLRRQIAQAEEQIEKKTRKIEALRKKIKAE